MKINCENCGKEHIGQYKKIDGQYVPPRFCSPKCRTTWLYYNNAQCRHNMMDGLIGNKRAKGGIRFHGETVIRYGKPIKVYRLIKSGRFWQASWKDSPNWKSNPNWKGNQ